MRRTSELPLNGLLPAPGEDDSSRRGEEMLLALVPTLEGMKEQMEVGAKLIGEVLERLRAGQREEKEKRSPAESSSEEGESDEEERSSTDETEGELEYSAEEELEGLRTPTSPDPPTITLDGLSSSSSDGEGFSSFIKAYR
jgi:hypothetical protein